MTAADIPYYEYKYLVESEKVHQCRALLDGMAAGTDPFPGGWMETIYYDTPYETCFSECMAGHDPKRKFRVRYYEDTRVVQAQVKEKYIYSVSKWKLNLSRLPCDMPPWHGLEKFADGDFRSMKALSLSYGCLVPAVRIRYIRRRYRYPGCRVNLDEQIDARLNDGFPCHVKSRARVPFALLEVKTASLEPYLPFLGLLRLKPAGFSKFAVSLHLLRNEHDVVTKYI